MVENQSIELKENWKDGYLELIVGFANANGGKLLIGYNQNSDVIGLSNTKKLQNDILTKIKNHLNINVDINILNKDTKEYLEIVVYRSFNIISYKGNIYYHNNKDNILLKDEMLNDYINKKIYNTWDQIPLNALSISDLDDESINIFKEKSLKSKRLLKDDLKIDNKKILHNLGLLKSSLLTRAAVLLFYKEPTKYFNKAYINIKFYKNNELYFKEDIKGSLVYISNIILEYINKNYLEKYNLEFSLIILNELINNAIIHNNYSLKDPLEIIIREEEIEIINNIYSRVNIDKKKYINNEVIIYNKLIANTFYKMGYHSTWGRGLNIITKECKKLKCNKPEYFIIDNRLIVKMYKYEKKEKIIKKDKDGKITGIQNYLAFHNYDLSTLNDKEKEYLYIVIEAIIFKRNLSMLEIINLLKISENKCKDYLNKIIKLNIIRVEETTRGNKYYLVKNHNLNN